MDQLSEALCTYELQWASKHAEDVGGLDRDSIFVNFSAELARMTDSEKETLLQCYSEFNNNIKEMEGFVNSHLARRKVVDDGNHLTRPDPDFKPLLWFKMGAQTIISALGGIQRDVDRIKELREKFAVRASLAWVHALEEECRILRHGYCEEIEAAKEALQRAQKTQKILRPFGARKKRIDALKEKFLEQPLDPAQFEGSWHGQVDLSGGISQAGMWICISPDGNIIDRIVRKNEYMTYHNWFSPDSWHGHPKDIYNRIPLEFYLQNLCAKVSDKHFARLRAYGQDHRNRILSLYVEYCSHMDLGWIQTYGYINKNETPMPEGALWMIFKHLVECCLVMRQGGIDTADPKWKQIVHRDIKPRNIFMDDPNPSYFPRFSTPKMGDFGLAFQTDENDPLNPLAYNTNAGTVPYKAPEQMEFVNAKDDEPMDDWKLLDYTNVYGIGALMFDLLIGGIDSDQPDFLDEREKWVTTNKADRFYSKPLLDLVMECIEWKPSARIKLENLQDALNQAMEDIPYLKEASEGRQEPNEVHDLWYMGSGYDIGAEWGDDDGEDDGEEGWNGEQMEMNEEQMPGASENLPPSVEVTMLDRAYQEWSSRNGSMGR